uniref:Retrovirus-related Pol polyprotein from transposon TNT 1-94 n=1 Tax=Cajanus cajan TaxID=3821 RepID=A0A151S5L0_CAJCA|nr:Retrovirus-related Pol polyprotein from transposon TNT 1-94 [Cajanus cajan]
MKDLGILKYFLGIEVARGKDGLFLSQRKYVLDIISEAGLLGARPVSTPLEQNHHLATINGALFDDPEKYQRLVRCLIYLTITRPELCYFVHILAQFMGDPRVEHWDAALRVLRYLKGCPGQGSSPVSQPIVSRSSTKAEYRSMATTTCELKWLKSLLACFGIQHVRPMKLFCDSQAALHIAANPIFHERTKHIEMDCYFIRDALQDGMISTYHIRTNAQLVDILTKALGKSQFSLLLSKLDICNLHAAT